MVRKKRTWLEEMIEAQQDMRFIGWVAGMDERLAWFRAAVIPEFIGDPYTLDAINYAEQRLLEMFPSREHMRSTPETDAIIDGFARFVGEAFVRGLGGQWMKIPRRKPDEVRDRWYSAVVSLGEGPQDMRDFAMIPTINSAVGRRSGSEFAWLWNHAVEDMKENGRVPGGGTRDLIAQLRQSPSPLVDLEMLTPKHPYSDLYAFLPSGRTVAQSEVRAIFDDNLASWNLVVSEEPYRITATDPETDRQIGVVLNIAGTINSAAEYIAMSLGGNPHPRGAEFSGATEMLYVYTLNDPDGDLDEAYLELAEAFRDEFGALAYLPNIGEYFVS